MWMVDGWEGRISAGTLGVWTLRVCSSYGLPLHSTTVRKAPPAAPYRTVRMLFPLACALIDSEVRQINRNPYHTATTGTIPYAGGMAADPTAPNAQAAPAPKEPSEDLLSADELARLVRGEEAAWHNFITTYERRIFAFLYRLEGHRDNTLDLTQETFMRSWRSIATFKVGQRVLPWLFQIARNTQIERHRRKQLGQFSLDEAREEQGLEISAGTGPSQQAERRAAQSRVQQALQQLSPEYREALVLRFMEDLPYEDIARVQGVALGTVKSRVYRAKEQLAALLADVSDLN